MNRTEINFKPKKNIDEWLKVRDNISKNFIPKWFQLIEWLFVTSILHYLAIIVDNITILIVYVISFVLLVLHIQTILFSLNFKGLPFIKTPQSELIASFAISLTLIIIIGYLLIPNIISSIEGKI